MGTQTTIASAGDRAARGGQYDGRSEDLRACRWDDVNDVDDYAGLFSLATRVKGHPAGTLVRVTVSGPNPSQVVLDFSRHQVVTDARVLLCGSIGCLVLRDLGYTGPLVMRPLLTTCEGAREHDERPRRASDE
jgi:hypothetical protein